MRSASPNPSSSSTFFSVSVGRCVRGYVGSTRARLALRVSVERGRPSRSVEGDHSLSRMDERFLEGGGVIVEL